MPIPEGWEPQNKVDDKAAPSEYSAVLHNQQKRTIRKQGGASSCKVAERKH